MSLTPQQQAWVDELRHGGYSQTTALLRSQEGHCCLGVACDIAPIGGWRTTSSWQSLRTYYYTVDAATNDAGIANAETSRTVVYSGTAITITPTETNSNPFTVTITLSEAMASFVDSVGQITVTGDVYTDFTKVSDTVYTISIVPTNPAEASTITVTVNPGGRFAEVTGSISYVTGALTSKPDTPETETGNGQNINVNDRPDRCEIQNLDPLPPFTPTPPEYRGETYFTNEEPVIDYVTVNRRNDDGTYNIDIRMHPIVCANRYEIQIAQPSGTGEPLTTIHPVNNPVGLEHNFDTLATEGQIEIRYRGALSCSGPESCRVDTDDFIYTVAGGEKHYSRWSAKYFAALSLLEVPPPVQGTTIDLQTARPLPGQGQHRNWRSRRLPPWARNRPRTRPRHRRLGHRLPRHRRLGLPPRLETVQQRKPAFTSRRGNGHCRPFLHVVRPRLRPIRPPGWHRIPPRRRHPVHRHHQGLEHPKGVNQALTPKQLPIPEPPRATAAPDLATPATAALHLQRSLTREAPP